MANPNRWLKVVNVAGAVTRIRLNVEERREAQRLAMMAALAVHPREAHTRAWEAQIPSDVDAPMHQLNDALAMLPARDVFARARQARDIWASLPGGLNPFE